MKTFKKQLFLILTAAVVAKNIYADGNIRFAGEIVEDTALVTSPTKDCVSSFIQNGQSSLDINTLNNKKFSSCLNETQEQANAFLTTIDKGKAVLTLDYM